MAEVVKTIGSGGGRDYSTMTAWEADLDDTGIYSSGDDAVGECYADSTYSENVTINGGGTVGLNSVKLTVAEGERHDGTLPTSGTEAVLMQGTTSVHVTVSRADTIVEWLSSDDPGNGNDGSYSLNGSGADRNIIRNCLVRMDNGGDVGIFSNNGSDDCSILNCIVFGTADISGKSGIRADEGTKIYNCTVIKIGGLASNGIEVNDTNSNSRPEPINCIAMSCGDEDFADETEAFGSGAKNNMSSDTTAPGSDSLTSKVTVDQFVSVTLGSEDLHLKEGSDAIGAGFDLGTTDNVNIDIDGNDRDALGVDWDMGAHQFETGGEETFDFFLFT